MAHHRHKREPRARRIAGVRLPQVRSTTLAAPLAVAATLGAVSFGVMGAGAPVVVAGPAALYDVAPAPVDPAGDAAVAVPRQPTLSRDYDARLDAPRGDADKSTTTESAERVTYVERLLAPAAVRKAIAGADTRLWTTATLDLWTGPAKASRQTGTVEAGERVLLTGRELAGRVEIVWKKTSTRWVSEGYLTDEKPVVLGGACTNGTTVPDGVAANIKKVHEAVCAAFPDITTYGTFRNDGEHSQGLAVDIMVSGDRGREVAEFVREHAADLGVSYAIYQQEIWSVDRSGEGWRGMEDRGSATANHFDHVHVTVF